MAKNTKHATLGLQRNIMSNINEELKTRYESFIDEKIPSIFFKGFNNYIRYVMLKPVLKAVVKTQFDIQKEKYQEIADLEKQTLAELDRTKKKLLKIIKDNKVDVEVFMRGISSIASLENLRENVLLQLEKFEKNHTPFDGSLTSDGLHSFLFDIAVNLLRLGFKDDLKEFLVTGVEYGKYQSLRSITNGRLLHGPNVLGDFIFSKTLPQRSRKSEALKLARNIELWGSFESMIIFYKAQREVIKDVGMDEVFKNCKNDTEFQLDGREAANVWLAVNDLKLMAENHKVMDKDLEFLTIDDFEMQISTINSYLTQLTTFQEEPKNKMEIISLQKIPIIEYNDQTGIGYLKGKMFKLKIDGNEHKVLVELYRNINQKVDRSRILVLVNYNLIDEKNLKRKKSLQTYKINSLAKIIRKKTRLNTKELVLNGGNLTLVGQIPPNSPQT